MFVLNDKGLSFKYAVYFSRSNLCLGPNWTLAKFAGPSGLCVLSSLADSFASIPLLFSPVNTFFQLFSTSFYQVF